jgi:AraC-like DNA-binding protein
MSTQNDTPMVSGSVMKGLMALLKQEEVDPDKFYQKFKLCSSIEDKREHLVPFKLFVEILNELQKITSIKHPALVLSKGQMQKPTPYLALILSAPSIDIQLHIARRFLYTYSEVTFRDKQIDGEFVIIQKRSFVPLENIDKEHSLYALAVVYNAFKHLAGSTTIFRQISLVQPEGKNRNEIDKFFGCSVRFSQDFDGIILHVNDLYKPNKNFDAKIYENLLEQLSLHPVIFPKNQQFSSIIKSIVIQKMSTGNISLKHISASIKMHPRAIQKRLLKENLTYKVLISDVRMNIAKRLLVQPDIPLIKVSELLGYSEASAFSRAFQAQFSCSPRTWRNNV